MPVTLKQGESAKFRFPISNGELRRLQETGGTLHVECDIACAHCARQNRLVIAALTACALGLVLCGIGNSTLWTAAASLVFGGGAGLAITGIVNAIASRRAKRAAVLARLDT